MLEFKVLVGIDKSFKYVGATTHLSDLMAVGGALLVTR